MSVRARRLLLLDRSSRRGDLTFLLRDDFTTPDAAPITSPRTAEPGPGTLTAVQTDGNMSTTGGKLVFPTQSTPVWGDQGYTAGVITRSAGIALIKQINLSTWEECGIGWHTAEAVVDPDSMEHSIQANTTDGRLDRVGGMQIATGLSASNDYTLFQILRSAGAFHVLYDGSNYTLLWVDDTGATASLYPSFANLDAVGTSETVRDIDLPANGYTIWSDYGIATARLAGARSAGDTFTHEADAIMEYITDVPAAGIQTISLREQDANNSWFLRIDNAGGLTLRERVASADTIRINSGAGVVNDGDRIVLIFVSNVYRLYVENVLIGTYTDPSSYFITETNGEFLIDGAGGSISDIIAWPRTLSGQAAASLTKAAL